MDIRYRKLQSSDLRASYEIRFSVLENTLRKEHIKYVQREAALADIGQGGGTICLLDGREVGFCLPLFIPEPYLAALFVVPECQGLGIGTELLNYALTWLRENGAIEAHLETDAGSFAEKFYVKKGWKQQGVAEVLGQNRYGIKLV